MLHQWHSNQIRTAFWLEHDAVFPPSFSRSKLQEEIHFPLISGAGAALKVDQLKPFVLEIVGGGFGDSLKRVDC